MYQYAPTRKKPSSDRKIRQELLVELTRDTRTSKCGELEPCFYQYAGGLKKKTSDLWATFGYPIFGMLYLVRVAQHGGWERAFDRRERATG